MVKEIMGFVLVLGLIVWAVVDFNSMQTVLVVLFERFVQVIRALADVAEATVAGS